ncbi:transporter [candidate division KSB1 bacterium]|nr:transporter [candidate division KSB1 bacterium]
MVILSNRMNCLGGRSYWEEIMPVISEPGILSILPVSLALILAFYTKDAVFSLTIGCIAGVVIAGFDPVTGLSNLFQEALGNSDFIWVLMIEVAVGLLVAFYMRSGVISNFTKWASQRIRSRKAAAGFGWIMGLFVFFSDYFSPLFSGPIVKPLTDRYKISREMLAYLLDSGSAPVCTLIPLSGWAVFIAGLLKGYGPIETAENGMSVFIQSIPYNFYAWLAVILAGLIAFDIVPNFGAMKRAEWRALKEGKVLRDGATPLTGKEMDLIKPDAGRQSNLVFFLAVPVIIIICISLGTFFITKSPKILEAFFAAVIYMAIAMSIGRYFKSVKEGMETAMNGIKAVLPAILILAMAYCINTISRSLGAQQFIISITETWMSSFMLPAIAFITASFISFFTGTAWGTYAIMIPFVLPIAMNYSDNTLHSIVFLTIGATVSGGIMGDHCSPVSDTTCLSSFGAGSDHIDHVTTQAPYALISGILAAIMYLVLGFLVV